MSEGSGAEEKDHAVCSLVGTFEGGREETYTNACGKRTLHPYTMPFRTALTSMRISWYCGLRTIFSTAASRALSLSIVNIGGVLSAVGP